MVNDEQIMKEWHELDNKDIVEVCRILSNHEPRIQNYLADYTSSLCDVRKADMMTDTSKVSTIHARWLFWYAYRYMTSESFARISDITAKYGKKFTEQSISNSVNKMGNMIASDTVWTKRWAILKKIIKLRTKSNEEDSTIIIQAPIELKNKITFKIQ